MATNKERLGDANMTDEEYESAVVEHNRILTLFRAQGPSEEEKRLDSLYDLSDEELSKRIPPVDTVRARFFRGFNPYSPITVLRGLRERFRWSVYRKFRRFMC